MQAGAVTLHRILDSDGNSVSPAGKDGRPRVLAVDEETRHGSIAVRVARGVCDLEGVGDSFAGGGTLLVERCLLAGYMLG